MLLDFFSSLDATTCVVFVAITLISWWYYTSRGLPPGPWGLPVLGYFPFLNKPYPNVVLHKLCQQYGNVISLKLGTKLVVVLGDYESIKEAYVKQADNFTGRPLGMNLRTREDEQGVLCNDGELWRDHRRCIMSILRDYGMGKLSLEPEVMSEIHCFMEVVALSKGELYDFGPLLGVSTANIISAMIFGQRFDYSDERFTKLRRLLDRIADLFSTVSTRGFFPDWFKYIPFVDKLTGQQELRELSDLMRAYFLELIDEHKKGYVENSRKDYIDGFLTEQKKLITKLGHEGTFGYQELQSNLQNLYGAGTETTTSSLKWGFLFMVLNPEMQSKVQKEIDDVIGMERAPSLSDRTNMIYTEAVLLETQRCGSVIPLNLVHTNLEETTVCGYRIPKRTQFITNLWAVHHDPQLWDKPEEFKPERFIDDAGKLKKIEYLIPFGIGKRACLGESLARMELFLYFTSIFQRFSISAPQESLPSAKEYEFGIGRRPMPYKVRFVQRSGYHVS